MGMEHRVLFPTDKTPGWTTVSSLLSQGGFPVQVRMINGELAFPDEEPPEAWQELRLGTPQGMVTVRREADQVVLVTWGNADAALVQAWNALTWAFAEAGGGQIIIDNGLVTSGQFRDSVDLPLK
jgi:hypothetical protein